jgi:methyl-branched lipid omega-hydroxylase
MTTAGRVPLDEIDLSDRALWLADRDHREAVFRTLRDTPGLQFFKERMLKGSPLPPGPGYWALVRHDDVYTASRNPQLFCSGQGANNADLPAEMNEQFLDAMLHMDDPKHHRLRTLVAKGFTPKEIARVEQYVRTKAAGVVDHMLEANPNAVQLELQACSLGGWLVLVG